MLLARLCRCIPYCLPWGEEGRCFRCGRESRRSEVAIELLSRMEMQRAGLAMLDLAIERTRNEMRAAGRFDHLYETAELPNLPLAGVR